MSLSFTIRPGYSFGSSEKVTYSKLNLLGQPRIESSGTLDTVEITDGAVTTDKLASTININSKISDHNLALNKLAQGTHGQILYYDSAGDLVTLAPGTDGYFLSTAGAGADPVWKSAVTGTGVVAYSSLTTNGLADQYLTTDSSGNIEWIAKPITNSASVFDTSDLATIVATPAPYVVTQAHGLGKVPEQVVVTLRCISDDTTRTGYVEGDEVLIWGTHVNQSSSSQEFPTTGVSIDATNVILQIHASVQSGLGRFIIPKKDGSGTIGISTSGSKFQYRIRAWAEGAGSSASNNAGPLTSEPGYYYTETGSQSLQAVLSSSDKSQTFVHGFTSVPRLFRPVIVVTEAISELGYAAGDEFDTANLTQYNDVYEPIFDTSLTLTSIKTYFRGTAGLVFGTNVNRSRLALTTDHLAKMKLKVYAWK